MNLFDRSKFAEDKDLPVTITWDQFKRDVSEVWVAAVKKQRMMQGMGLLTPAMIEEKYSKSAMSASPQDSSDSEKMVKIMSWSWDEMLTWKHPISKNYCVSYERFDREMQHQLAIAGGEK